MKMNNENMKEVFDPMKGIVAESASGGLPVGNYVGEFVGAEYLPVVEPDAMTGKGGRQFPQILFKWLLTEGEHKGKTATRETPAPKPNGQTLKTHYIEVCGQVV